MEILPSETREALEQSTTMYQQRHQEMDRKLQDMRIRAIRQEDEAQAAITQSQLETNANLTREIVADVELGKATPDDIEQMTTLEKVGYEITGYYDFGKAQTRYGQIQHKIMTGGKTTSEEREFLSTFVGRQPFETGLNPLQQLPGGFAEFTGQIVESKEELAAGTAAGAAVGAGTAVGLTWWLGPLAVVPAKAGAVAGGGTGLLTSHAYNTYKVESGAFFGENRNLVTADGQQIDQGAVTLAAHIVGTANAGLEAGGMRALARIVGLDSLIKWLGKDQAGDKMRELLRDETALRLLTKAAKELGIAGAKGAAIEGATEALQSLVAYVGRGGLLAAQDEDYFFRQGNQLIDPMSSKMLLEDVKHSAYRGALGGASVGMVGSSVHTTIDGATAYARTRQRKQLERSLQSFQDLRLRNIDPDRAAELADDATGGKMVEVPVGTLTRLFQSNDERLTVDEIEDLLPRLREARETGNDVSLSIGELARIAASLPEGRTELLANVRMLPGDINLVEENLELSAETQNLLETLDAEDRAAVPQGRAYQDVYRQMQEAGASQELATYSATYQQLQVNAMAHDMQMSPDAVWADMDVNIVGEGKSERSGFSDRIAQAGEVGYKGTNAAEAIEWLEAGHLDLSREARHERAAAMGFNVEVPYTVGDEVFFIHESASLTDPADGGLVVTSPDGIQYSVDPTQARSEHAAFDADAVGLPTRSEEQLANAPESDRLFPVAVEAAKTYAEQAGIPYTPQEEFAPLDRERATRIAAEYDRMLHDPHDPEVKAAYQAMIDETIAQYRVVLETGLVVTFVEPGAPYYGSPREAIADVVENNHLLVFPTDDGFGTSEEFNPEDNPLLQPTEFEDSTGRPMVANDVFRVVHDYFGHIKHGSGFRARGEENAWQSHAAMYSPLARRAMTTETRGQNSWVNFGPYGEQNRTATSEDTVYADQKIGLLPIWVSEDGRLSARDRTLRFQLSRARGKTGFEGAIDDNGWVELIHYARNPIERTDPGKWGQGLSRRVREETNRRLAGAPPRAFFGIESALQDGYRKEQGLGSVRHVTHVPGELLYFVNPNGGRDSEGFDPDNLWDGRDLVETEKRIKAAGYIGYVTKSGLGKVAAVFDEIPVTADGSGRLYQSSVKLRGNRKGMKRWGIKPTGKVATREVAAALEARQRDLAGPIDRKDTSDEAQARIARWMVEEVKHELQHPEQSGAGWYSFKFQRALDTFGEEFPELKDDQGRRDLLTALIAVTSDGQQVGPNFAMAIDYYANWRKTGKMETSRGHNRIASIHGNVQEIQRLWDEEGPDYFRKDLLREDTVGALSKRAAAAGIKFDTGYQVHMKLPMAAVVFGPKLGAFYANLMGAHGYLTMDRWWSRTFNRYRGQLLKAATQDGLNAFRELLESPNLTDDEVLAAVIDPRNRLKARGFKTRLAVLVGVSEPSKLKEKEAWHKKAREAALDQYDELLAEHNIERAANTIHKAAFEELEDAPWSASDRTFMVATVNRARRNLKRGGVDISIADIQAVLWYYEKRLYGELGARQTADTSYQEAARDTIDAYRAGRPVAQDTGETTTLRPGETPGDSSDSISRLEQSDRLRLGFRDVTKRIPELTEAAQRLKAGELTREEYRQLVDRYKPAPPYARVPPATTRADMTAALTADKAERLLAPRKLEDGHPVGLRLDIPAYRDHGAWVVAVHEQKSGYGAGASIGYDSVASVTQASFGMVEKAALAIAAGKPKGTIATIKGNWKGITIKDAQERARAALSDPDWVQVGMDPERRSVFYERGTMRAIRSADEVIQIGPLVLAKNPAFDDVEADVLYQGPRGWTDIGPERKYFEVTLTGKADESTFIHESMHVLLEYLLRLEDEGRATARQLEILRRLRLHFEFSGDPSVDDHEAIAQSFEGYMREGNAPSEEMRDVFAQFRTWMTRIYKTLRSVLLEEGILNEEVSETFDMLLATDDQIARAREADKVDPVPLGEMLSDAEVEQLDKLWQYSIDAAYRRAGDKAMNLKWSELRKEYQAFKRSFGDRVDRDLDQRIEYQFMMLFKDPPDHLKGKVDRTDVLSILGVTKIPKGWKGKTKADGIPLDAWAITLGVDVADLANAVANMESRTKLKREAVNAELRTQFGEFNPDDPESLAEFVRDSLHNPERAEYLVQVLRALDKRQGNVTSVTTVRRELRSAAEQRVRGMPLRLMDAMKYARASRKLQVKIAEATRDGKHGDVRLLVKQQLLNEYMYQEIRKAQEKAKKLREQVNKANRRTTRERLGKLEVQDDTGTVQRPYRDAFMNLTRNLDMKNRTRKELSGMTRKRRRQGDAAELQLSIALIEKDDPTVAIAFDEQMYDGRIKHYTEITYGELLAYTDTIKSILHAAKGKAPESDLNQRVDNLVEHILENATPASHVYEAGTKHEREYFADVKVTGYPGVAMRNMLGKVQDIGDKTLAALLKMEFFVRDLDGGKDIGLAYEMLFARITEAQALAYDRRNAMGGELNKIFSEYGKSFRGGIAGMQHYLNAPIDDFLGHKNFRRRDLLSIAMHMGTESNLAKLIGGFEAYYGYQWTRESLTAALEQHLTARDIRQVQKIWNLMDSMWTDIADVTERTSGVRPEKLPRAEITIAGVRLKGGYMPLAYDLSLPGLEGQESAQGAIVQRMKNEQSALFDAPLVRKNVNKGFTEARTGFLWPIRTDLSVITEHISETIQYVTHYEALSDAWRIVQHPKFRRVIMEQYGEDRYNEMNAWLKGVANDGRMPAVAEAMQGVDKLFARLNRMASLGVFGANVESALKQIPGVALTFATMAPHHALYGITRGLNDIVAAMLGAHKFGGWQSEAMRQSFALRELMVATDREQRALMRSRLDPGSVKDAAVQNGAAVMYFMMSRVQTAVNTMVWYGAYHQGVAKGLSGKTLIHHADSAVRMTQSASGAKDLAALQRDPGLKSTLTFAYSWFNNLLGMQYAAARRGQRFYHEHGKIVGTAGGTAIAVSNLAVLWVLAMLVTELFEKLLPGEEEEEKEPLEWGALQLANFLLAGIPVARDVPKAWSDGYDVTIGGAITQTIQRTAVQAPQILFEVGMGDKDLEDLSEAEWKALYTLPAWMFPVPVTQAARTTTSILAGDGDPVFGDY